MELFATDQHKFAFLLETDAYLHVYPEALVAAAAAIPEIDLPQDELPEGQRPKYVTDYIGSKAKLLDWIWKYTPEGVESVLDAFCGSSAVAYMYKTRGLAVTTNDQLRYAYHTARAIIENPNVRLTQADVAKLLSPNNRSHMVRDNFGGIFFAKGVHEVIDAIRGNIEDLSGVKRDIALCALGKTCITCRAWFSHFSASTTSAKADNPEEFRERFVGIIARINALIFDNGQPCKALHGDVNEALANAKVDLAYFDPPYATEFSTTNYEKAYHFVEGLMTNWEGLEIKADSTVKAYTVSQETISRTTADAFFEKFLANAAHIKHWLISYRDKAFPSDEAMTGFVKAAGKDAKLQSCDYTYRLTSKLGDASHAKELLFICAPSTGNAAKAVSADPVLSSVADVDGKSGWDRRGEWLERTYRPVEDFDEGSTQSVELSGDAVGVTVVTGRVSGVETLQSVRFDVTAGWDQAKAEAWLEGYVKTCECVVDDTVTPGTTTAKADAGTGEALHTSFLADVTLTADAAMDPGSATTSDPTFNFILCHEGTNRNGDHFTREELSGRCETAVNKKIDLQHSQGFPDIVGGIIGAEYRDDGEAGPRIECVGELYVNEAPHAPLAYKTMKRGIISQVSMECDYEEGECSICGKRRKTASDACIHLRKNKGGEYQGKPVFEILHNVTFTGVGILDKKGADEGARITQVASQQAISHEGGSTMDPVKKDGAAGGGEEKQHDDAAKKPPFGGGGPGAGDGAGGDMTPEQIAAMVAKVKALEDENAKLKEELAGMKEQQQMAANKAKASALIATLEQGGMPFGGEQDRTAEVSRLAELDPVAFAAAEASYQRALTSIKASAAAAASTKVDGEGTGEAKVAADTQSADASAKKTPLKTSATVRPTDVDDANPSLADALEGGFMAAFGHTKDA